MHCTLQNGDFWAFSVGGCELGQTSSMKTRRKSSRLCQLRTNGWFSDTARSKFAAGNGQHLRVLTLSISLPALNIDRLLKSVICATDVANAIIRQANVQSSPPRVSLHKHSTNEFLLLFQPFLGYDRVKIPGDWTLDNEYECSLDPVNLDSNGPGFYPHRMKPLFVISGSISMISSLRLISATSALHDRASWSAFFFRLGLLLDAYSEAGEDACNWARFGPETGDNGWSLIGSVLRRVRTDNLWSIQNKQMLIELY